MRTTITLDPDVATLVAKSMQLRQLSFKVAVNEALRAGLTERSEAEPYDLPTFAMGRPRVDLDHATTFAGDLEDQELLRKMQLGK